MVNDNITEIHGECPGWVQNSQNEIQALFQDFSSTRLVKFKHFHTSILWYQYSIEIKFEQFH